VPTKIIKSYNATAQDTVRLIKLVARNSINNNIINVFLKLYPYKPTLAWFAGVASYINTHFKFISDAPRREQVKHPDRLVRDGGGDCDDYTTLWKTLLNRVNVQCYIKIISYNTTDGWAHVYAVVPVKHGKPIILDSVYIMQLGGMNKFNKEIEHYQSQIF
jgi:predicted transglutaminase-like cysteine proteinase